MTDEDRDLALLRVRVLAKLIADAEAEAAAWRAERLALYQRLAAAGVRHREIADAAGVSDNAVAFALHDARKRAKEEVGA